MRSSAEEQLGRSLTPLPGGRAGSSWRLHDESSLKPFDLSMAYLLVELYAVVKERWRELITPSFCRVCTVKKNSVNARRNRSKVLTRTRPHFFPGPKPPHNNGGTDQTSSSEKPSMDYAVGQSMKNVAALRGVSSLDLDSLVVASPVPSGCLEGA